MTTKAEILKAIRRKCLDCCVYQSEEVKKCTASRCDLHPFRFGRDPNPPKVGFAKNPPASRGVFDGKGHST